MTQRCPICDVEVAAYPRYPNYLCATCASRATDAKGVGLEFFNTGVSGGYAARYQTSGAEYQSHECFVNGVRCWADEARFGGIVIQPI